MVTGGELVGSISGLQVMRENWRNWKVRARESVVRSTKWSTAIFWGVGGQKGGEVLLDGRDDRHFLRRGNHGFLVFPCGLCPQIIHFPKE